MAARYNFHLSIYSNCDKIVGTEAYLKTRRGSLSQHFIDCVIDRHYPIALCLDPTKTDQEVLLATIESISNDLAQAAYKANFIKASSRGINITPDMLSNFGLLLLPSIQYASGESIDYIASQNEDRGVTATSLSPSIAEPPVIPIVEKLSEDIEDEDEEDEDDYENMTDEEYLVATAGVIERPVMKS